MVFYKIFILSSSNKTIKERQQLELKKVLVPHMDADGWRRILASNNFGTSNSDLRKAFAKVFHKLCSDFCCFPILPLDTIRKKSSTSTHLGW